MYQWVTTTGLSLVCFIWPVQECVPKVQHGAQFTAAWTSHGRVGSFLIHGGKIHSAHCMANSTFSADWTDKFKKIHTFLIWTLSHSTDMSFPLKDATCEKVIASSVRSERGDTARITKACWVYSLFFTCKEKTVQPQPDNDLRTISAFRNLFFISETNIFNAIFDHISMPCTI